MSFLKRLFGKDYRHCMDRGEAMLADHRYFEARDLYEKARDLPDAVPSEVEAGLRAALRGLAELNIAEAEARSSCGDADKAREHLHLAISQATDMEVRQKAERLLAALPEEGEEVEPVHDHKHGHGHGHHHGGGGCSCSGSSCKSASEPTPESTGLSQDEEFHLLTSALPMDLPDRYRGLGRKFADAFMLSQAGEVEAALAAFREILREQEDDVVLYETGILSYRAGYPGECERLLRKALALNAQNPLCYLGLVEMYAENGKMREARELLEEMLRRELLTETATLMLGDVCVCLGDEQRAMDLYGQLLPTPMAKEAAKRVVPLLEKLDRPREAAEVAKKFLGGCGC